MPDQRKVLSRLRREVEKFLRAKEDQQAASTVAYYDDFADRLMPELERMLRSAERDGSLSYQDYQRLQLKKITLDIVKNLLPEFNQNVSNTLRDSMETMYQDAYLQNAWVLDNVTPPNAIVKIDQIIQSYPTSEGYDVPAQTEYAKQLIATDWQGAMFSQRIGEINDTMAHDIQVLTTNAALNGQSVSDLSQSIRNLIGVDDGEYLTTRPRASRAKYRADTIARSELGRMVNAGKLSLFDQNKDLIDEVVWSSSPGPTAMGYPTCEDCEGRDGMTRTQIMDGEQEDDNEETDPPLHPRCRCTWIAQPKSYLELLGPEWGKNMSEFEHADEYEMKYYDPDGSKIASMTVQPYDEWLAERAG